MFKTWTENDSVAPELLTYFTPVTPRDSVLVGKLKNFIKTKKRNKKYSALRLRGLKGKRRLFLYFASMLRVIRYKRWKS